MVSRSLRSYVLPKAYSRRRLRYYLQLSSATLPVPLSTMSTRTFFVQPILATFELTCYSSMIGNGGDSPNGSGGMIPSTAPPFAMTRWFAQTRRNYVSVTSYNVTGTHINGF